MSEFSDAEAFAAFLRSLKHRSSRSYQALAVRLGVSDSALQRYCSGRQLPLDYGLVERFARECGANRDELGKIHLLWSRAAAARAETRVPAANRSDRAEAAPDRRDRRQPAIAAMAIVVLASGLTLWWGVVRSSERVVVPQVASCGMLAGKAGMAAWWRLDEDQSTIVAADSSGRNAGATRSAGAEPVPGRFGRAVRFTGGAVRTERPVVATDRSFSVSAWVRLDSTTDWATAVSQDGDRASGFFLQYSYDDEKWSFAMVEADVDNARGSRALSVSLPRTSEWTHLVGVHDAGARRLLLYLDGALEGTAPAPEPRRSDGPFAIGRARWNGIPADQWRGDIDDVCVFATALGPDQVRALRADVRHGNVVRS